MLQQNRSSRWIQTAIGGHMTESRLRPHDNLTWDTKTCRGGKGTRWGWWWWGLGWGWGCSVSCSGTEDSTVTRDLLNSSTAAAAFAPRGCTLTYLNVNPLNCRRPCGCLWSCFSDGFLAIYPLIIEQFQRRSPTYHLWKCFKQILFRLLSHRWKPFKTTGISPWTSVAHKIMGVDLRLTWRKGHSHLLPSAWSISREILELAARTLFGRT